jgi:3-oxoacyl-[acyl-carrier protein] reductase
MIKLDGKKILITGVSRPVGIGATLAKRIAEAGAIVAVHGFSDYDVEISRLSNIPANDLGLNATTITSSDLEIPGNAEKVIEEAVAKIGALDGLILNHAYSTYGEIGQWTPEHIDPHLLVNVRASMMMIQSFTEQADTTKDNAITLFTSGQYLSPMVNEIA